MIYSPLKAGLALLMAEPEQQMANQSSWRPISERDLLLHIQSRAVRRLAIVQTEAGSYRLCCSLKAETQEFVLVDSRGQAREWSSLDSLAKQIRCKYGAPAWFAISLWHTPEATPANGNVEPRSESEDAEARATTHSIHSAQTQEVPK